MGFKKGYVLYYLKCIITNTASLLDFERWPREGEILIKYVIYHFQHSFIFRKIRRILRWFLNYAIGDDFYVLSAEFERSQ